MHQLLKNFKIIVLWWEVMETTICLHNQIKPLRDRVPSIIIPVFRRIKLNKELTIIKVIEQQRTTDQALQLKINDSLFKSTRN